MASLQKRIEALEERILNHETATKFELHYGEDVFEELAHTIARLFELRYGREPTDAEAEVLAQRLLQSKRFQKPEEWEEFVFVGF